MTLLISNKNSMNTQISSLTVLSQPNINHTLTQVTADLLTLINKQCLSTE